MRMARIIISVCLSRFYEREDGSGKRNTPLAKGVAESCLQACAPILCPSYALLVDLQFPQIWYLQLTSLCRLC